MRTAVTEDALICIIEWIETLPKWVCARRIWPDHLTQGSRALDVLSLARKGSGGCSWKLIQLRSLQGTEAEWFRERFFDRGRVQVFGPLPWSECRWE